MPSPRKVDPAALTLRLHAHGPQTAQALATAAGADRSRISRALTALGPAIVRLGTTRGTSYSLRRPIRALGHTFPIRRIDADGRPQDWAEITALHGGWRLTWATPSAPPAWSDQLLGVGGFSEGFPFFLSEVRPQGFLGSAIARALPPALGLDPDPRNWATDDDTLVYLASEGDDLSGDLIVGDLPLRRFQNRLLAPPAPLPESARATRYPELAATAASSGAAGSSVEGEQPKFLVTLGGTPSPASAPESGTGIPPVMDGEASRLAASDSTPAEPLAGAGMVIGGLEGMFYKTFTRHIPDPARLYLLSDGVYEISRADTGGMWSLDELRDFLGRPRVPGADELDALHAQVRALHGPGPLDDDFTIVRFDL